MSKKIWTLHKRKYKNSQGVIMWSTFLVIRIMQIKTIMRYNFIPSRANTFKNIDNTTNSIH